MVKKESIETERVMTPFEEALESGMFFKNGELMEVVCDKKSQHSEVIHRDAKYTLNTQAFGGIPVANMVKIKIYANRIPNKVLLKIDEEGQR